MWKQWGGLKPTQKEQARERISNLLLIADIFPAYLKNQDFDLLIQREKDLSTISHISSRIFQGTYILGAALRYFRGKPIYFRNWIGLLIGFGVGSVLTYHLSDRIAADLYYNKIIIDMANRYNVTREEVMSLQTALNKHKLEHDRKKLIESNNRSDSAGTPLT